MTVSLASFADETCPTYADVDVTSVARSIAEIEPRMENCAEDAIAAGVYGGLLLRSGRIGDALVWLEKALLLNPEQPGVQADYALALAAQGDRFSSKEIAGELLKRDEIPQDLESILSSLSEVSRWESQVSASAGLGFSTNIDFVPSLDSLDVTFGDDGIASLPLVEAYDPDSAGFFQQSAAFKSRWTGAGYSVLPSLRIADRSSAGSSSSDYVSVRGGLQIIDQGFEQGLRLSYTQVNYGGDQDRGDLRLGYSRRLGMRGSCQLSGSADWLTQSFGPSSINDTRIYQAGFSGECGEGRFWSSSIGFDRPLHDRVGGNRTRLSVSGGQQMPVEVGVLTVSGGFTRESDAETYSSLLARGAARQITTLEIGATWQLPLSQQVTLSAEAGIIRQSSNIALFDATASEMSVNLIYTP